jgi:hypothetical protein
MYHPYSAALKAEDPRLEYIELFNFGQQPESLTGWRFTQGVDFAFPDVVLPGGGYLVVAADVPTFKAAYPGVSNVVGGWTGQLSDSGETITLCNAAGAVVNEVPYADEGDWGVRVLGPLDLGHRGWEWSDDTDGGGKSLELIDPAMPNEYGQNWAASATVGGTPGRVNSVASANIAPMIEDVMHAPAIPGPADPVTVTASVIDQSIAGVTVRLRYRVDRSTYTNANTYPQENIADFSSVTMFDDGAHEDGAAGDGIYGAQIPKQPDGTIIEFFVEATDSGGRTRTWPAPSIVDGQSRQVTNALYRVDASLNPFTYWKVGSQPIYYIVMTEMERHRLEVIGTINNLQGPNCQMNATFISVDGADIRLDYRVGVRNRGHGTRHVQPNQYHVAFPHDQPWKGLSKIDLNTNYTPNEVTGAAILQLADIAQPDTFAVQVRVNGQNLAPLSMVRTSGSYAHLEAVDSDWASRHIPDDNNGNAYKCMRSDSPAQEANLQYLGPNRDSYRIAYSKETHAGEDDWSDLIELTRVLSDTTSDAVFADQISKVANVEEWLRFLAVNSLVDNEEKSIGNGTGDEYCLYSGVKDTRFLMILWDLEAMFGIGDELAPSATHDLFRAAAVPAISRLMKHPQFAPRYYWHLKNLAETIFSPEQFNPLLDRLLGSWVPAQTVSTMKSFTSQRCAYVLSVIPQTITVTSAPAVQSGYPRTTSSYVALSGQANAITTRRVMVNGQPAVWTAWQATWSIARTNLLPGINRVVIQAFDANDREVDRVGVDIWYDTGSTVTKTGTLGASQVWTAAGGPYHVTGNITISVGGVLTIEPGATVFLDSNCGFIVHGRLFAQGMPYSRIRFTHMPGTTNQWGGFQFPDTKQDNVIAYADVEFGGSRSEWITVGNNNAGVVGPTARLTVDHATFSGSDTQYFNIWDPQIIIRNSVFADLGTHYLCKVERMPADGWFIIEGNLFGHCHGDNDVFHLNSVSVKGGPVAQIIDNVFTGGGDDILDDNETDTHIEGNLLMHANIGNTARSASAAVTTGPGGGSASTRNLESQHLTVVRNIFYQNDYGILSKTEAYSQIYNNVFIQNIGAILFDEPTRTDSGPGRASYVESCIFWNNGPEADGTATDNGSGTFVNRKNTQLTVNNCIVKSQFLTLGTGNIDADPLLVNADRELYVDVTLPRFNTGFPGFAEGGYLLEGMVPDVHVPPESPAVASGFNGVDMGFYVPTAASIGGAPTSPTYKTDATLTVGGTDMYGYKYAVMGPGFNGAWSAELARMMPITAIRRSGLVATATVAGHGFIDGDIVEIVGADQAAYNGLFVVFAASRDSFSFALPAVVDLLYPTHLDVWVRKPQPIHLTGLTNGTYVVSAIKKNSMGVWQDANQPTMAAWTVDTAASRLIINEILALNHTTLIQGGTSPDLVELYYDGPTAINLSGMSLSDDPLVPVKYVFPPDVRMNPGDYLVLFADSDMASPGIHLGFALGGDGGQLHLYRADGHEIDSVVFGHQVPDLSIGRVGRDGAWRLTIPTFGKANEAQPLGDSSKVKINEWLACSQVLFNNDFVELYNPEPLPVDIGGLYLTDAPAAPPLKHVLPPLSFIAANGFAAFTADSKQGPGNVDFKLSPDGEVLALKTSDFEIIDQVIFGPQTSDVSEARMPDGADTRGFPPLPTPGLANGWASQTTTTTTLTLIKEQADKRVLVPTAAISDDWKGGKPFDDSSWMLCTGGPGGVGFETTSGYESLITLDLKSKMYGSGKNNSCYIRVPFTVDAGVFGSLTTLTLKVRYDDGFVAYLNGQEVARANFTGTPAWNSHADTAREAETVGFDAYIDISQYLNMLKSGSSILAVQLMNSSNTSSDLLLSVAMDGASTKTVGTEYLYEDSLKLLDGLRITELMYHAKEGDILDYIELQNISVQPLDLTGVRFTNGVTFTFPAMTLGPGQYTVVVANTAAFTARYGATVPVAGQYSGHLSDKGEEIVLTLPAPQSAAILRFGYENSWYPSTDGGGQSLNVRTATASPAAWQSPDFWKAADPTPGKP